MKYFLPSKTNSLFLYGLGALVTFVFISSALFMYKQALRKKEYLIHSAIADEYFSYHQYKEKALFHYQKASKLYPKNEQTHAKVCRTFYHLCAIQQLRCKEAVAQIDHSVKKFPDSNAIKNYHHGLTECLSENTNQTAIWMN